MVSRGSSIHHTRRTNNPFMTTSSGIVGINLAEKVAFDAPRLGSNPHYEGSSSSSSNQSNPLTEFMYQTTSRQQGEGGAHAHERSKLSQRMDKLTLRRGAFTRERCVGAVVRRTDLMHSTISQRSRRGGS